MMLRRLRPLFLALSMLAATLPSALAQSAAGPAPQAAATAQGAEPQAGATQGAAGAALPLSPQQFDALVDALSKSVAERLGKTPPAAATPAGTAPAAADHPGAAKAGATAAGAAHSDAMMMAMASEAPFSEVFIDVMERGDDALEQFPSLVTESGRIPTLLSAEMNGGRSRSAFFLLLAACVAAALAVEALLLFALRGPRSYLAGRMEGAASIWALAALVSLDVVVLTGLWLATHGMVIGLFDGTEPQARLGYLVLTSVFYWRLYLVVFRIALRPGLTPARLAMVDDHEARAIYRWASAVILVAIALSDFRRVLEAIHSPQLVVVCAMLINTAILTSLLIAAAVAVREPVAKWFHGLSQEGRPGPIVATVARWWLVVAVPVFLALGIARVYGALTTWDGVHTAILLTMHVLLALVLLESFMDKVCRLMRAEVASVTAAEEVAVENAELAAEVASAAAQPVVAEPVTAEAMPAAGAEPSVLEIAPLDPAALERAAAEQAAAEQAAAEQAALAEQMAAQERAAALHAIARERAIEAVMRCLRVAILLVSLSLLVRIWVVHGVGMMEMSRYNALAGAALPAGAILLAAYCAWQAVDYFTGRHAREGLHGGPAMPGTDVEDGLHGPRSRMSTLLPLLRVTLMLAIIIMAGLTLLGQLGIDVMPLIAGASIIGLAISFGSQTLVKDIVSGVFYLVDDAFRVGEYIDCGKAKGTVEGFTLRSLKLRHQNGMIHTIPFGQLGQITNFSRDWTTMKFNLRFTRDTDLEKLRKTVKKIGAEMLEDPELKEEFLAPLKMQGVADIIDNALIVRFKFTVRPIKPTVVRREAIKRMVYQLPQQGIQFANNLVPVQAMGGDADTGAGAAAAVTRARIANDLAARAESEAATG
ncbi:mechanosensitive ion channel family protein [Ancylobacter sp. MQZ15Z-1]|uniref:Mechanosensitive ion channel family protein n=1 Tax=Ancylobacter mangrovi TaxID=2972472 RepID=A0A9X2T0Q0_9HYPH|nr:mechanosensitive ion channel family protein [Ancylobacter mangrovi]MCS0494105.1 mechanosensitive ion channel family protein [Ancylobacter mangrovi]